MVLVSLGGSCSRRFRRLGYIRWLQGRFVGLDRCAGYSGCMRDGDIALATADAHGRRTLRWRQRMSSGLETLRGLLRVLGEGGSGCEEVAKVVSRCKEVG